MLYWKHNGDGFLNRIESISQLNEDPSDYSKTYRIRSTVMNSQVVYENGRVFVHAGGTRIATQESDSINGIKWNHKDPNLKSFRSTWQDGSVLGSGTTEVDWDKIEVDSDGKSVGFIDPGLGFPPPQNELFNSNEPFSSIRNGQFTSYSIDGINVPREHFAWYFEMAVGGAFGVMEWQARVSNREVGRWYRRTITPNGGGSGSDDDPIRIGSDTGLYLTRIVYDQSWAVNLSLLSFRTKSQQQIKDIEDTEGLVSSADFCDKQKKVLFRTEAINAFQKAWNDSEYGVEGKQKEQGGLIIEEPNPNGASNLIPKEFTRIPNTAVNYLDGFPEWKDKIVKDLSKNQNLLYYYHTHPFKVGVPFTLSTGKVVQFTNKWELEQPTNPNDYDNVLPGSFGVLITANKLILFDGEKIRCKFNYKFAKKKKN